MVDHQDILDALKNARTQEVFRAVVQHYLDKGEAIGSRDLSKRLEKTNLSGISPASIRNDLSDLEDLGLLTSLHTSAGRKPNDRGLQFFIDTMFTMDKLDAQTVQQIDSLKSKKDLSIDALFDQASQMVAGLSQYAAIVTAPRVDRAVKSIDFEPLQLSGKVLAIISFADGTTDNRLLDMPRVTATELERASNYLRSIKGKTLKEIGAALATEIREYRGLLDALAESLEGRGLVSSDKDSGLYFVHGQSGLLTDDILNDKEQKAELRRVIDALERKEIIGEILRATEDAQPVRVFVGAQNNLFKHAELSVVTAGLRGPDQEILGALAVIGPKRMHYARIVPVLNHSARAVSDVIQRLDRKAGLH